MQPSARNGTLACTGSSVIHRAVRLGDAKATPPQLRITRPHESQVVVEYSSPGRLCALAKGIMRGIAQHYNEPLVINETTCMHSGARACTLVATRSLTRA